MVRGGPENRPKTRPGHGIGLRGQNGFPEHLPFHASVLLMRESISIFTHSFVRDPLQVVNTGDFVPPRSFPKAPPK